MQIIDIRCPKCNRLACQLEAVHTGIVTIVCKKCKATIEYNARIGKIITK